MIAAQRNNFLKHYRLLHAPQKALTERLLEEIQELRKRTRPLKELDPPAERVVSDLELRRLVEKLGRRRAHFKGIEGYLEGLEEGLSESQERADPKENVAGAQAPTLRHPEKPPHLAVSSAREPQEIRESTWEFP